MVNEKVYVVTVKDAPGMTAVFATREGAVAYANLAGNSLSTLASVEVRP